MEPDLILSGHWVPLHMQAGNVKQLMASRQMLKDMHSALLPLEALVSLE